MAYFFKKITNMKIGTRLFFGFLLVIMIVIAISAFSIKSLLSIQDHSKKNVIVNNIGKHLDAARRYRLIYQATGDETGLTKNNEEINTMLNLVAEAKKMAWDPDAKAQLNRLILDLQSYKTYRDIFVTADKKVNTLVNGISQTESQDIIGALRAKWQSPSVDPETQLKFADITFALSNVRDSAHNLQIKGTLNNFETFQNSVKTAESIKTGLLPQMTDSQRLWLEPAWQYFSHYSENGEKYYAAFSTETQDADHLTIAADNLDNTSNVMVKTQIMKNDNIIHQVIVTMYIVSLLSAITGLFIAGYITRQITRPIKENLALAEKIASGDLTADIHSHRYDELGQLTRAMGNMNEKLRHMITDIRESIISVASASSQIAEGNNDLSSRTEEQSAAVVETAASMEQLTSTVKRNAGNAHQASQLAVGASANAVKGGDIVGDVVKTMDAISSSSKRISDIISVINGISFQTNILALNAAVEAARAGEQGRGFAVVANEVRSLAKRSADAAKEIESLITESVTRVADGSRLVFRAGETMEEIVRSVANVSEIMNEIASASDEQSRGIAQIGIAVSELDTTTQQNASLVQESSAAASSLEEQAMLLTKMVSVFKLPKQKNH